MGYTHYWERPENVSFTDDEWALLLGQTEKLINALPKEVNGYPLFIVSNKVNNIIEILSDYQISFNGSDETPNDEKGYGHEDFYLTKKFERKFEFCKTAHKPYDLLVTSVLFTAQTIVNWLDVSSDGDMNDWRDGLEFAQNTLNISDEEVNKMSKKLQ